MSDEDDELAILRRERAARLGSAGLTVTSLRSKLEQDSLARGHGGDDDERPTVVDAAALGSVPPVAENEGEDDGSGIPAEFRAHFPAGFGAQKKAPKPAPPPAAGPSPLIIVETQPQQRAEEFEVEEEDPDVGPSLPPPQEDRWRLPVTSEAVLDAHSRAVVALDLDYSGSRLLTGSHDYTVKIFDFNGMKSDCRPFRSLEPSDGHPVVALSWSPSGDAFLVVTGSQQPKVYDRDGKEQGEMPRGDMYIRDMKNTKGHVTACSGGAWHPSDKGTALTCSDDGTLRLWDMWSLEQRTVIKPTLAKPGRVAVTACCWGKGGGLIAGGLMDGTLQVWDVRGKFGQSAAVGVVGAPKAQAVAKQAWSYVSRAGQIVRGAHAAGTEVTCLRFSHDGNALLSRGADETLKLWDVRKLKAPVASTSGLATLFSNQQCCFSPDEKLVVAGVSPAGKEGPGALCFYDATDLSLVRSLGMPGSAVAVAWHPKMNQIIVGCGDRKQGAARVLYDAQLSSRGALLVVGRRPRQDNTADFVAEAGQQIYNPNALPMYREAWPGGGSGKGKRKIPVDASIRTSKSFKPDVGQAGVAKGAKGKLGTTGGTLLTQYIMKHQGELKNPAEEDVRASFLRHAGKEDEFSRFTSAYEDTQPQKIYAEEEAAEEEEGGRPVGKPVGPPPAAVGQQQQQQQKR